VISSDIFRRLHRSSAYAFDQITDSYEHCNQFSCEVYSVHAGYVVDQITDGDERCNQFFCLDIM
jgi:hypothetical protein